jgi:hypothetical protein
MQRKRHIQILSNLSTTLLVSIILVSVSYFHFNIDLVYGQNITGDDAVIYANEDINDRNFTSSTKVFEPIASPTVGSIITLTNPTVSQDNNTTEESNNNNLNNNTDTVANSYAVTNTSGGDSIYLPSSSLSQYTNSTENMTGAQEGDGQEIDTGDEAEQALTVSEAQALKANLVIPDSSPFKSDQCTPADSLEKFVPNPFMKDLGTTRFIVGNCITVTGKVTWTHYMNSDGDANFNVKLDRKYNSLLTPANMNDKKLKGTLHIEVVCQGKNSSKDPIKINQCKDPKYDGPDFRKVLPKVGSRVQIAGIYVIDIREGGHAELHPAYQIKRVL